jgi:hypothetical protein
MYAGRASVGRVHLWNSLKKRKQQSKEQGREYWYGRPESLKDTVTYRELKEVIKPIKTPKKIPPKTLEAPQYGRQFYYSGKPPLWTTLGF